MVYPDMIIVLIKLLIEKGVIKDINEWDNYYKEYMKNMEVNKR